MMYEVGVYLCEVVIRLSYVFVEFFVGAVAFSITEEQKNS